MHRDYLTGDGTVLIGEVSRNSECNRDILLKCSLILYGTSGKKRPHVKKLDPFASRALSSSHHIHVSTETWGVCGPVESVTDYNRLSNNPLICSRYTTRIVVVVMMSTLPDPIICTALLDRGGVDMWNQINQKSCPVNTPRTMRRAGRIVPIYSL